MAKTLENLTFLSFWFLYKTPDILLYKTPGGFQAGKMSPQISTQNNFTQAVVSAKAFPLILPNSIWLAAGAKNFQQYWPRGPRAQIRNFQ